MIRRFFHGERRRPDEVAAPTSKLPFNAGDLLSVLAEDGQFGVMKVLAIDDFGVHVRLYTQRFKERPGPSDLHGLSLTPVFPAHEYPFSFGHMPFSHSSFASWEPQALGSEPVSDEELVGYRLWQKEYGGYF